MRLISCHIDNFGKLSNFDFDFSKGVNVIFEDNGYGKSTLSAFLRVMLYGFDNETKKGELIRERSRFAPWQGGNYGGNIVLETDAKRYLITRQFGKKESDDYFELRDADTMLVSSDYSSNIGEQIFGIDSDSFKRSVMFSQNDCETNSTDGINAKLGNLTESTDDINNFEKVDSIFHKLLNEMTDSRKTGTRAKLKDNIYEIQADLRRRESVETEYNSKLELLEGEKESKKKLCEQADNIEKKRNLDELNRSYYVVREQYEKLIGDKYNLENEINNIQKNICLIEKVFDSGIPSEGNLIDVSNRISELKDLRNKKSGEEFSYSELADYNRLSALFANKNNPSAELDGALGMLDRISEYDKKAEQLEGKIEAVGYTDEKASGGLKLVFSVCGLTLGIIAVAVTGILFSKSIGGIYSQLIVAFLGIVITVISIIGIASYVNLSNEQKRRYNEYTVLSEQLESVKAYRNQIRNTLLTILANYNIAYDKYDTGRRICRLRDDYIYYNNLCIRKNKFDMDNNSLKITELCNEISAFFKPYEAIVEGEDFFEQLYSLKAKKQSFELYLEKKAKLNELKNAIKEMEDSPNFLSVKEAYKPVDSEESSDDNEIVAIKEAIESCEDNIREYHKRIEALEEEIDKLNDEEIELKEKSEELDRQNEKAKLLEQTRYYLNEAKVSFVNRYSEPITNNFRKYFELLDGNGAANYSFDANTNLNILSEGKIRKPEAFSRGMRDLAGIAFRMSLTEAMYKAEKPYLIMDDPFVNLDDTRINGALKLIDNISQDFQVIYFTCSSSRVPNI